MTTEHYKTLLSLYKLKVSDELNEEDISQAKLSAKIELDKAIINNEPVKDIEEYINELNKL